MQLFIVDAFTDSPFAGNSAGVVLLNEPRDSEWMQSVAEELKHSETAFVDLSSDPIPLRWFTPGIEVDLCGHATLAAAHVLHTEFGIDSARFTTRSGILSTIATDGWITMAFPADPPTELPDVDEVSQALQGTDVRWAGRGVSDILVVAATAEDVHNLVPNLAQMAKLDARGVVVTASGGDAVDFTSRAFYPAAGVPEDPVTGSAHCTLASYWSPRLGKTELTGHQASPRGGVVRMRLDGGTVHLSGRAVTTLRGTLTI